MAIEATVNPGWKGKWALIGVFLIGLGLWHGYDAAIQYPRNNEKALLFEELSDKSQWPQIARERGWSEDQPGHAHKPMDIAWNWGSFVLLSLLGIAALILVAARAGLRIGAGDHAIELPGGRRIPYANVTSIDKSRWDGKGIAIVHYKGDTGRESKLKIDAWLLRNADHLLREIESRTGLIG